MKQPEEDEKLAGGEAKARGSDGGAAMRCGKRAVEWGCSMKSSGEARVAICDD